MKLRHHDIVIPTDGTDPFVNCKLNRKKYAEILTDIVGGYADGFVLAINNPWGEGKTTFVKMWRQHLINEEFQTLYFNAWENDFEQDVMVALISELSELKNKSVDTFTRVLDKAVSLTNKVLPAMAKHLAKKAIGDEAVEEIIEGAAKYGAETLKEQIDSYTSRKKSIQDFKDNLELFISEVDNEKPLIFIVDELDRCRPNYAVEVLEQIKHIFSVPGIVFVLSIDKNQLGNAIRGFYGSNKIDADEYLRRFINLNYSLPPIKTFSFFNHLVQKYDFKIVYRKIFKDMTWPSKKINEYENFVAHLFKGYSLRSFEQMVIRIIISVKLKDDFSFREVYLLTVISFLANEDKVIYDTLVLKEFSPQKVLDDLEFFAQKKIDKKYMETFHAQILHLTVLYSNELQVKYYNEEFKPVKLNELMPDGTIRVSYTIESKIMPNKKNLDVALEWYCSNNYDYINLSNLLSLYNLTDKIYR